MNSRHMIAAAALALMGAAASASPSEFTDMPSTASRAEVMAEASHANIQGRHFRANDSYGTVDSANLASVTTREEVLAELAEARASGELDVRGEVYGDLAHTQFGNLNAARSTPAVVAVAEPETLLAYADTSAATSSSTTPEGLVYTESSYTPFTGDAPLAEPALTATDADAMTAPNDAAGTPMLESSVNEPVVLWVPIDGEAVTLQPGEAVLLVPSDETLVPTAE